jgi:hypothetical protein
MLLLYTVPSFQPLLYLEFDIADFFLLEPIHFRLAFLAVFFNYITFRRFVKNIFAVRLLLLFPLYILHIPFAIAHHVMHKKNKFGWVILGGKLCVAAKENRSGIKKSEKINC